MKVTDFNFELPEHLVAHTPAKKRDHSALMYLDKQAKQVSHHSFYNLANLLRDDDVLVLNNSKVFNARLRATKNTGASIEVLLLTELSKDKWQCLCKPAKRLKEGDILTFSDELNARVLEKGKFCTLIFSYSGHFFEHLERLGEPPLPPYIQADDPKQFSARYQTVYAAEEGSVAAPTAGLHFTADLLSTLKAKGLAIEEVTLHVGYGTFKPVTADTLDEHVMHEERFYLDNATAARLMAYKQQGRRIIAVGTTSVRVLETAFDGQAFRTGSQASDIFIYPGYEFSFVDGLITNFHLPQSTLIMLVAAFAGKAFVLSAYREAINKDYRFYSFGDAMLIL